jgi:hypothetical protein
LRVQSFSRAEVLALWQKAIATAKDASISGLSVDSAIRLAYDAGARRRIGASGGTWSTVALDPTLDGELARLPLG